MGPDRSAADCRLPNLGNQFPLGPPCRRSQQSLRLLIAHSAGELTQVPNNRQLRRRFASQGGTPRKRNCIPAAFFGVARMRHRGAVARRGGPAAEPIAVELKNCSGCGELRQTRCAGAVDTLGVSDRLENRKTCGISIGSALFIPPVKRSAALLRRSSRRQHAEFDGADGELFQCTTGRGDSTVCARVVRCRRPAFAVGQPPRLDFEITHRSARIALNSSPPSFFKGPDPPGLRVPKRAARALQCSLLGMIHERPRCR